MDLRTITAKKPLKLLVIMLSWLIVASASAAVYYSLTMEPSVTVTGFTIEFSNGDDTTADSTVYDAWCGLGLRSYPNATLTYDQAVNITNTDGANGHSFQLDHVSITPDGSAYVGGNFTYINMTVVAGNGTELASFDYTNDGTNWSPPSATSYLYMQASEEWTIKVVTLSPAGATEGTVCDIMISVNVQE
jgi:hypothetical protein